MPTSVFNLQTMGWSPPASARRWCRLSRRARCSTLSRSAPPATTGSTPQQINIPKDLGADTGRVRNIHIVLCDRAPCQESDRFQPQSQTPLEPARPFFVNPTSCPARHPAGTDDCVGNRRCNFRCSASDVVLTMSGNHNLTDGAVIKIEGATGSQAALNGTWNVTVPSARHLGADSLGGQDHGSAASPRDFSAATIGAPEERAGWRRCRWNPG